MVSSNASYLDSSHRDDALSGGARRIAVSTPKGEFKVWVKRVGNNPDLRLLLLHGGPGATHEYLEACDTYLPAAGSTTRWPLATIEWARQWPCEEVWKARKVGL